MLRLYFGMTHMHIKKEPEEPPAPPAVPPACSELIPGNAPVSSGDQPGLLPAVAPDTGKRHKRGSNATIVDNAHRVGIPTNKVFCYRSGYPRGKPRGI